MCYATELRYSAGNAHNQAAAVCCRALQIAQDVVSGLMHLHSLRIVHVRGSGGAWLVVSLPVVL